ncbi:MAG: hypothetical protein QM767_28260 [Anaeromyxobacter sp.]
MQVLAAALALAVELSALDRALAPPAGLVRLRGERGVARPARPLAGLIPGLRLRRSRA